MINPIYKLPWKAFLRNIKHYWIALAIFLVGVLLSLTAFHVYKNQENKRIQIEFNRLADIRIFFIKDEIAGIIEQLNNTKQFFYASPHVSREGFRIFTRNALNIYPDLLGLGWYSMDNIDSTPELNKPSLNFVSLGLDLTTARSHFFLLDYLELSSPHKPFYVDSREFREFHNLLKHVQNNPSLTISDQVDFFQEGLKSGFFIFDPVFNDYQSSEGKLRDNISPLQGIVIGFANFETIFRKARAVLARISHKLS